MNNKTINYYNKYTKSFIQTTRSVDFTNIQNKFLSYLPSGASILDFGCGSGRDTKYFLKRNYNVTAIDGSEEICKEASKYTGIKVKQMLFEELNDQNIYDGIWACASILHLSTNDLLRVFHKMNKALKENIEKNGIKSKKITIITNDFHECRASEFAKQNGFKPLRYPSKTPWNGYMPFATREIFAIIYQIYLAR